jgi:ribonucleoside-diphosphate reductase alpha chain
MESDRDLADNAPEVKDEPAPEVPENIEALEKVEKVEEPAKVAPELAPVDAHSTAELVATDNDAPICMNCGVKMRPAGSCHICEQCGSTSGCS